MDSRRARLARAFGSQCFFRVPIRRPVAAVLPAHLVFYRDGVPCLQSIDPSGLPVGGEFVTELWRSGVAMPAIAGLYDIMVVEVGPAACRFDAREPSRPRSCGWLLATRASPIGSRRSG